jgi:hypothetical protein
LCLLNASFTSGGSGLQPKTAAMSSESARRNDLTLDTKGEIIMVDHRQAWCDSCPPSGFILQTWEVDPKTFLSTIDGGRKVTTFPKKQPIFVQGDSSDAVFYLQEGKVRLTVVSTNGKEAIIGILNEGDFFGEGCLTGQPLRLCSATAMTDCSVMRINKKAMMEVLHREHAFSDMFVAYLLTRNIRYEEDLVDQLFQFQWKTTGTDIAIAGAFRQGR